MHLFCPNGSKLQAINTNFIRWKGIRGFIGMQRGIIEIENEYEENPVRITLRTLQEIVVKRYPKSQECRSGLWEMQMNSRRRFSTARPLRKWRTY